MDEGEELMGRLFPRFDEEEAFVTGRLDAEERRGLAEPLRRVVLRVEDGEERRRALLDDADPTPRRSGRRPRA